MADSKISALSALSIPALNDLIEVVDVSDTSMAASGTNKYLTPDRLLAAAGGAPQLRLTTEAAVPVSSTDRTAQGTLRAVTCLPGGIYTGGIGFATTWDGTRRRIQEVGNISAALTLTVDKLYDAFIKNSDLSMVFSTAWTNDTTRADALATAGGLPVASADNTYLWLGTIRASGTNVTADSGGGTTTQVGGQRFVWNAHNQVQRPLRVIDTANSWSYTTDTIRQANAATGNKVEYVTGDASSIITANVGGVVYLVDNGSNAAKVGVGVDSTTVFSGTARGGFNQDLTIGIYSAIAGSYIGAPGLGYHAIAWCEKGGGGTSVFLGDNGGDSQQTGLQVVIYG